MSNGDDYSSSSSSSLETPRRIDFEDALPPASTTASAGAENHSESMFVDKGRSLKALALLSLGLKRDDGSDVFNPSVLPWSAATRKTAIKMTAGELREEVLRRSVAAGNKKHPRPSQWTVTTSINWLNENPIKNTGRNTSDCLFQSPLSFLFCAKITKIISTKNPLALS